MSASSKSPDGWGPSSGDPVPASAVIAPVRLDTMARVWPDVAMKQVGVAELKNNLSKYLRSAEAGEPIEVTDHDRPIARLVPIDATRLVIREPARRFGEIAHKRYRPIRLPISSLELLMQERGGR